MQTQYNFFENEKDLFQRQIDEIFTRSENVRRGVFARVSEALKVQASHEHRLEEQQKEIETLKSMLEILNSKLLGDSTVLVGFQEIA